MSLDHIVTPLDAAVLDSKDQYALYFKVVGHAFNELEHHLKEYDICSEKEAELIKQYCQLLIYSVEALRVKYLYDEEDKMKVDLTDSGFPNYMELRYLVNDLELRNEHIRKLPSVDSIRKEFLDSLMKDKKHISKEKLFQASSILYYTSVQNQFIFKRFVQGKIIKVKNVNDSKYLVSWSFYDVTYNRPFICFMYFNFDGDRLEREYEKKIFKVLETTADRSMNLDNMAYVVDKKLPKVLPTKFKRIDLGPLHTVFAKDENEITHTLLKSIFQKEIELSSFAMSMSVDEITSKGHFTEGGFLSKQELQIWAAEQNQKYLFSSHRVIQLLYSRIPEVISNLTKPPFQIEEVKEESRFKIK